MEPALRNIVRTYLRFGDRKALDELKVHRETLIYRLKALDRHFDTAKAVEHLEDEVAMILDVSEITVKRDWKTARAWLISHLHPR